LSNIVLSKIHLIYEKNKNKMKAKNNKLKWKLFLNKINHIILIYEMILTLRHSQKNYINEMLPY
jgi:hypothetical protein